MENVLFLQFLEHPAKTFGTISSGIKSVRWFQWSVTQDASLITVQKLLKQKLQSVTSKICTNRDPYRTANYSTASTSRRFHFLLAQIADLDL